MYVHTHLLIIKIISNITKYYHICTYYIRRTRTRIASTYLTLLSTVLVLAWKDVFRGQHIIEGKHSSCMLLRAPFLTAPITNRRGEPQQE